MSFITHYLCNDYPLPFRVYLEDRLDERYDRDNYDPTEEYYSVDIYEHKQPEFKTVAVDNKTGIILQDVRIMQVNSLTGEMTEA